MLNSEIGSFVNWEIILFKSPLPPPSPTRIGCKIFACLKCRDKWASHFLGRSFSSFFIRKYLSCEAFSPGVKNFVENRQVLLFFPCSFCSFSGRVREYLSSDISKCVLDLCKALSFCLFPPSEFQLILHVECTVMGKFLGYYQFFTSVF